MGIYEELLAETAARAAAPARVPALRHGPAFSTDIDSGTLYGTPTADQALTGGGRVTRAQAMSVPAVRRARDIICGGLGSLPMRLHGPDNKPVPWELFDQPEPGVASVVTWTRVVDDLFFEGRSWLRILNTGWHGYATDVLRLERVAVPEHTISVNTETGSGSATVFKPDGLLIRIDSANDPLLTVGARAIRTLLRLETAALNAAEGIPPADYFQPTDEDSSPFDEGEDDDDGEAEAAEVEKFLDSWAAFRRKRSTGWVPPGLQYKSNSINPRDLQLVEAREMAIAEIARLTGVDGEDLGVSTTSRVYFNAQDRRRERLDFTMGGFQRAIESRLSMDDVTPPVHTARFDVSGFVATDDKTAAETDQILIDARVIDPGDARDRRGLAPRSVAATAATHDPKELP